MGHQFRCLKLQRSQHRNTGTAWTFLGRPGGEAQNSKRNTKQQAIVLFRVDSVAYSQRISKSRNRGLCSCLTRYRMTKHAERKKRQATYHEAGHAVVAVLMGIPFVSVTVAAEPVPDEYGRITLGQVDLKGEWPTFALPGHVDFDPARARRYAARKRRHDPGRAAGGIALHSLLAPIARARG